MTEKRAEEIKVLFDRKRRVEVLAQTLRHIGGAGADAVAMRHIAHIAAQNLDLALLDHTCPGQQRQKAGLSDPVWPDQPDHAPLRDLQRHIVKRRDLAIAQRQAGDPGN